MSPNDRAKTRRRLNSMFKSALGCRNLPAQFTQAVNLITEAELPPQVFDFLPKLRHIVVNPSMGDKHYLGCYFPVRLEATPGTEKENWKKFGWDGQPHMMIFSSITPEVWVILHEFAHYLDDAFVRMIGNNPQLQIDKRRMD